MNIKHRLFQRFPHNAFHFSRDFFSCRHPIKVLSTLEKTSQQESCELGFIWGKMRTALQETTPQRALRNRETAENQLQRTRGEDQYMCDFGEGGIYAIKHRFFQRFLAVL